MQPACDTPCVAHEAANGIEKYDVADSPVHIEKSHAPKRYAVLRRLLHDPAIRALLSVKQNQETAGDGDAHEQRREESGGQHLRQGQIGQAVKHGSAERPREANAEDEQEQQWDAHHVKEKKTPAPDLHGKLHLLMYGVGIWRGS